MADGAARKQRRIGGTAGSGGARSRPSRGEGRKNWARGEKNAGEGRQRGVCERWRIAAGFYGRCLLVTLGGSGDGARWLSVEGGGDAVVGRKQRSERELRKTGGLRVVGVVFSGDNSGALSEFVSDGWMVSGGLRR